MKRILTLLFAAFAIAACKPGDNPWSDSLLTLTVQATLSQDLPDGHIGAAVTVEEVSSGATYKKETGSDGAAVFSS